ncbi:hypothetical protein J2T09_004920 [Neorhizobium huautlense]|uniref:DUF6894 domain-containing protein n=1 Tax=Neorhizobium huautlense TaxID=67774 RepID=A0ABT9Q0X4_9HYPH|nr:hypothetical protein [Neorhizobium huautlense]MDP9840140.1 hypothetical protein [Neorhizobium huautlense]
MPRYFYNVRTAGVLEEDKHGAEFLTYELAYEEAIRSACEIVGELIATGSVVDSRAFEITNEAGEILDTLQ